MDSTQRSKGAGDAKQKLSQQEADDMCVIQRMRLKLTALIYFSTALNQRNSPLLRLPGELRNQIYEYVIGGLTIDSLTKYARTRRGVHPREAPGAPVLGQRIIVSKLVDRTPDCSSHTVVSQALGFLTVCRRVFSEAHLMPFTLSTLAIRPVDLEPFLDELTAAQRNAITTYKVSKSVATTTPRSLGDWNFEYNYRNSYRRRSEAEDTFLYWSDLDVLSTVRGLERVLVGNQYYKDLLAYEELDREMIVAKIQEYVGGRIVQVEFDDRPVMLSG
jgi:hypothetical protein